MAITLERYRVREIFRGSVLRALDDAAKQAFENFPNIKPGFEGATDADLPALFASIDTHLNVLCKRYGVELIDN